MLDDDERDGFTPNSPPGSDPRPSIGAMTFLGQVGLMFSGCGLLLLGISGLVLSSLAVFWFVAN